MPKYKPLTYKDVTKILKNLGFAQSISRSTSHQTWTQTKGSKHYAVTVAFHGHNQEFKRGTLSSMIRQSGRTKDEFYRALKKKQIIGENMVK